MRRTRILQVAILGLIAACAADPSARSAPKAATPAPTPQPLPHLFGDSSTVPDGASLRAAGADSRVTLWMLGREGAVGFVAQGGRPLTGFAAAPNRGVLFEELASREAGALRVARVGAGSGAAVTLDEPAIAMRVLLERVAKLAGATSVAAGEDASLPTLSVSVKDAPADALLAAIGQATGTTVRVTKGVLTVTGTAPATPSPVIAPAEGATLDGGTLIATVVDARRRQALLRDAKGTLRLALGDAAGLAIEDGAVRLPAATLRVEVPPPQSPALFGMTREGETKASDETRNDAFDRPDDGGGEKVTEPDRNTESSVAAPPPTPLGGKKAPEPMTDSRAKGRSNAAVSGAGWAVEPFREKAGWLGKSEASLAKRFRGDSWGDAFALALERALRERGRNAMAVPQKLTDDQKKALAASANLRWVVAGDLRALTVEGTSATLAAGVQVQKQVAGKMQNVDARTITASRTIAAAAPTEDDLLALVRDAAEKAADAVALTMPSDLLAGRN